MEYDIPPSDLRTCKADDRGRINLGTGYANKRVVVAIVDEEEPDDD